ncbi:hypothetical protein H0H93_013539 [Arthromyces matolae]|nr:hypothetical protein H0H93_013539 [Arthromyces matolae]
MATVVERPLSALGDIQALPTQRRPSVVEIIDVDQFIDDNHADEMAPNASSRPLSRASINPQEVIVIDSDDDEGSLLMGTPESTRSASSRRRLVSPPPPAPQHYQPPEVPQVPQRFSMFTGLPRRSPNAATPPVIRPIERNFGFGGDAQRLGGAAIPEHPNRHRRFHVQPRGEPEPHHIPTLGLGGAIIALNDERNRSNAHTLPRTHNRRILHNHINVPEEVRPGLINRGWNFVRQFYTTFAVPNAEDDNDDDYIPFHQTHVPAGIALNDLIFHPRGYEEIKYKPEYTHPGQPEPGYSFNFAPAESPPPPSKPAPVVIDLASDSEDGPIAGPSKLPLQPPSPSTTRALLVCARCTDSLLLGGGLVGDEGRRRKIWALKCGHMIDGKCLDVIGAPDEENKQDSSQNAKGKGKAKIDDNTTTTTTTTTDAHAENTVRSRLRSRVPLPPIPHTMNPESPPTLTTLGKRKRGKPRIEATYEWKCPVKSCEHLHASVKIDGVWLPEPAKTSQAGGKRKGKRVALEDATPGRGPIAVYV